MATDHPLVDTYSNAHRIERIARILYPTAVALVAYASLWVASLFDEPPAMSPTVLLSFVTFVVVLSEAIRWYSHWLEPRWPWYARPRARLIRQLMGSAVIAIVYAFAIYVPLKLLEIRNGSNDTLEWPHLAVTALMALVFAFALNALSITLDFYTSWQRAQRDARQLEELILRAELDALKSQINPHFLFNSLYTVQGLIPREAVAARALIVELGDVMRYALSHGSRDLVPLARELEFLEAYRALLQARHGTGIRIEIGPMDGAEQLQIPPMSLQVLVENAVRHNRTREDEPLVVQLRRDNAFVEVSNPLRPRHSANPGAGTGLANLDQRYRLLGAESIRISQDGGWFVVKVGLLPCAP
ncbi:MAG: histidine kinase [Tahibacter sp.]